MKGQDMDVQEIKRAAVARLLARQREPQWKVIGRCQDGTDVRSQTGGWTGDFAPPADAAEWFDDRLARLNGPVPDALYAIADAARSGRDAAVAAVAAARAGRSWDQWCVYLNLLAWRNQGPTRDADQVLRAILAEWHRLGLVVTRPDDRVPAIIVNQAELDATARRRRDRGAQPVPAGVLPWE
jgi:hypothetical protein